MNLIPDYFFIELNNQKKDTLVKISPIGEVKGLDNRVFIIDGEKVLENTKARAIDIVLNKDHKDGEALGWFDLSSLVLKQDGIYAKLELNNLGKEAIENRYYRYLSPELAVNSKNREVHSIVGIGLVNSPNLLNKALNKTQKDNKNMQEELQKEINSLNSENQALKKEINTLEDINKTLQDEIEVLKETNKINLINSAINSGELLPSQKEFAMSLELNSLNGYLASVKGANTELTKALKTPLDIQEQKSEENAQSLKNMGWE